MPAVERFCVCLNCGAPLVSTFEVRKKEWVCVPCGEFVEFLHVGYATADDAMRARYEELKVQYDTERAARQAMTGS